MENSGLDKFKRVRIRLKYSATVSFSWQEDKDGTNKQTDRQTLFSSLSYLVDVNLFDSESAVSILFVNLPDVVRIVG